MRKQFRDNQLIKNENGYTLLIVLMVLVVISVLGLGLLTTTANTMKLSDKERVDQATYYIAEAGLVQRREQLNQIVNTAFEDTKTKYLSLSTEIKRGETQSERDKFDFEKEFLKEVQLKIPLSNTTFLDFEKNGDNAPEAFVTVSIKNISNKELKYKITSTGKIASNKKRTLSQNFTVSLDVDPGNNGNYISKFAVHTTGSLFMSNGSIFGQVATAGENSLKMTNSGAEICLKPKSKNDCLTYATLHNRDLLEKLLVQNVPLPELPIFPDDKFIINTNSNIPGYQEDKYAVEYTNRYYLIKDKNLEPNWYYNNYVYPIHKDQHFANVNITTSNSGFTIDIGNSDINLYIDGTLDIQSKLSIKGNGSLTIYANDMNIHSSKIFDIENSGRVHLVINNKLSIKGDLNSGNTPLTINTSELQLSSPGKIQIQDKGTASIYVKNKISDFSGYILTASKNTKQATIYYQGPDLVLFNGAATLYGSLYAKQANLHIGSGASIRGDILSGGSSILMDGGANVVTNQYILAPLASINMGAGFDIIGSVICNTFDMSGGAKITHPSALNDDNSLGETITSQPDKVNKITSNDDLLEE
ncbi:hypothetical protein MHH85_03515 [Viridibacillus sp. FSL E2-0187]|uniref:DUF7305 domain-containing protein n=1 Tax=Viridibacillus sp. FSL E2-0187 TaxID=2921362 RepID=UPI0030F965B3